MGAKLTDLFASQRFWGLEKEMWFQFTAFKTHSASSGLHIKGAATCQHGLLESLKNSAFKTYGNHGNGGRW